MTHSARFCMRCGKELTDAASMERGIGPVCGQLDAALFAATIPANLVKAYAAFSKVNLIENAELAHTLVLIEGDIRDATSSNVDWRATVKRIEWVLSHKVSSASYDALISTVEALGYVGLVSLWNGGAASGLATVTFEAGRLWVAGPRVKGAIEKIKTVYGRMFHPKTVTTPARWSVPAAKANEFEMAIKMGYPNNKGLSEAVEAAKMSLMTEAYSGNEAEIAQAEFEVGVSKASKVPAVLLTVSGDTVSIKAPYNPAFIGAIKNIPWKDRSWDKVAKVWTVKLPYKAAVEKLVSEHYKAA